MEDYPLNIIEFEKLFTSEEACRNYVFQLRWPDGFRCSRCDNGKFWLTKRLLYHCSKCEYETSITAGTIFQDTRHPLYIWFRLIWYIVNQKTGISALGLQRALGLKRYETIWIMLHKLRSAMVRPDREQLSGIVEVDETYIGGKKPGKRGRGAAGKTLVFIAVEGKDNHIGRIRLKKVQDASAASLVPTIQNVIAPGSSVRTDDWNGYKNLSTKGYEHIVMRQSANVGENLLPLAHRVAGLLKKWLEGTHQGAVHSSHLDFYLDEFTFRFNRRTSNSRGKLFFRLIQQAVNIEPVRGRDIIGGRSNPKPQDMVST